MLANGSATYPVKINRIETTFWLTIIDMDKENEEIGEIEFNDIETKEIRKRFDGKLFNHPRFLSKFYSDVTVSATNADHYMLIKVNGKHTRFH